MGSLVTLAVSKSVEALLHRNGKLSREVMEGEEVINRLEIEIDDLGHGDLAIGQPLAGDLRLVTSILKINTDLERIGDHAVNIAERALLMSTKRSLEAYLEIPEMAGVTLGMLKDALESFRSEEIEPARSVLQRDDVVDAYNDRLYSEVEKIVSQNPVVTKDGMNLILVGHNLERIADLANNIAESVIYFKQGTEVRHHHS